MTLRPRTKDRRPLALTLAAVGVVAALVATPMAAGSSRSLGELNSELGRQQSHQQQLESSLTGLAQLISSLSGQITLVRSREAAVQNELAQDRARLASTEADLAQEQHRVKVLRARLSRSRWLLARQLVSNYESGSPDLVSVILQADGFKQLLEKITYLKDAEHQQQRIIAVTRTAKAEADAAAQRLARLELEQQRITHDAWLRERALAGMNSLLESKQATLRRAESIKQAALSASRTRASQLRAQISQIEAQQAAARAAAQAQTAASAPSGSTSSGAALGPSNGWAIPYQIVLCESGGQNLPPNSAGASGYYQILASTWKGAGGTGPAAYLASKAEQDAVASRLWAGGAGASNWVCAGMLGIH
jgi:peptidoglycan hydrolase CwlO-like protein